MGCILLLVGGVAILFLLPIFMDIWSALTPSLSEPITNPLLQLYYVIVPYAWVIIFVIAAFIIVSRRRNE